MTQNVDYYIFGEFRIDSNNCDLTRNGKPICLNKKGADILLHLVKNQGVLVTKEALLKRFWEGDYVEEANLTQQIHRIRKSLSSGQNQVYIETVPKRGYRFTAEVEPEYEPNSHGEPEYPRNVANEELLRDWREDKVPFDSDFCAEQDHVFPNEADGDFAKKRRFGIFSPIMAGAILLTLAIVSIYFLAGMRRVDHEQSISSVAILPFRQIGGKDDEKLALGIADILISRLSKQKKIRVSPTSSIIRFFEDNDGGPLAAGKQLGVDAVITGTIQREGDTIRINVQCLSVDNKAPVWSSRFDEKFSNIFDLQDVVSARIAERFDVEQQGTTKAPKHRQYTDSIRAFENYSMGIFFWNKRTTEALTIAKDYFAKAIEHDNQFASAHIYLADTYLLIGDRSANENEKSKALEKSTSALERASKISPDSPQLLTTKAVIELSKHRGEAAVTLLQKAIEIDTNNVNARRRLAAIYAVNGKLDKAIVEMRTIVGIDPLSPGFYDLLARFLSLNNKPEQALVYCKRAIELNPAIHRKITLAQVLEQQRRYSEAEEHLREVLKDNPNNGRALVSLSRTLAKLGRVVEGRQILDQTLKQDDNEHLDYGIATIYLQLNEDEKALSKLLKVKPSLSYILFLQYDYKLDSARNNPVFDSLFKKVKGQVKGKLA